jgi:hypothetical protein
MLNRSTDTADAIAWRFRMRNASEIVACERPLRFPNITADNAGEVLAWQESRIAEIVAGR